MLVLNNLERHDERVLNSLEHCMMELNNLERVLNNLGRYKMERHDELVLNSWGHCMIEQVLRMQAVNKEQ